MSSNQHPSEKVTFGAVVNSDNANREQHDKALTPSSQSPFYAHPAAQPSLQSLPDEKEVLVNVYDTDLEAGCQRTPELTPQPSHAALDLPTARPVASYASTAGTGFRKNPECTVWPTKETLRDKARQQKVKENEKKWGGSLRIKWDGMTKKQRMIVRGLVFLLIVALAVGLGVGISKAVHGGVYAGKGVSHSIPDTP
ncbi:hypothetical protein AAFC00_003569 [Neodothiora populina]|uniref:Uncharacterized protein n=1 Tax=Neodothiora populina TaxID=2781224 RepID=A0ABR3PFT3_9PEZI